MRWHNIVAAAFTYLVACGNVTSALPNHAPFAYANGGYVKGSASKEVRSEADSDLDTKLSTDIAILETRVNWGVEDIFPHLADFMSWVQTVGTLSLCLSGTFVAIGILEKKWIGNASLAPPMLLLGETSLTSPLQGRMNDVSRCVAQLIIKSFSSTPAVQSRTEDEIAEAVFKRFQQGAEGIKVAQELFNLGTTGSPGPSSGGGKSKRDDDLLIMEDKD